MADRYAFGIDVGGTTIKHGLFDAEKEELVESWEIPTRTEDNGRYILEDIAASVKAKMEEKKLDVKDVAYRYDGSFAGFLCCVFESFTQREIPSVIAAPEAAQLVLFEMRDIPTETEKARRVATGLKRLGMTVYERVAVGFLSCAEEKDLILLRFIRLCFAQGGQAAQMLGHTQVAQAFALERAVNNEICRMIELLRFEEKDGMLGAQIHPQNRVLPMLRSHFCSRLPDDDFLIYDATHKEALLRRNGQVQFLRMERYEASAEPEELAWQTLWKRFFKALTIEERRNERLQTQHVPLRYRQDMPEMRKDVLQT